ncbi:hypothetical protein [Haloarcula nitratireducens]|uniref:Uncharacterized protein n=1 Tax=Haloarcula nitratireducens TaxID=2487749 RepID=A0AAW4PAU4_9EURY|nr:hypothetical protein [Halomicroarcula nitratireducens]MBX0295097.1 hypothetical protein [Halomicroarcula nitratireducens]
MATAEPVPVARRASHGVVSLVAGFLTGFALFSAIGAAPNDALFSALSVALLVAFSRSLA